jgi:hypothetical protein
VGSETQRRFIPRNSGEAVARALKLVIGEDETAMDLTRIVSLGPAAPAAVTIGLLVALAAIDRRLQATGGSGIIPFELAGPGGSDAILARWGDDGRRWAIASLVLDFPFLAAYTALNLVLVERLRQRAVTRGDRVLAALARPVAALQIVAGACDAVENAALLLVVARRGDRDRAALAVSRCAHEVRSPRRRLGLRCRGPALLSPAAASRRGAVRTRTERLDTSPSPYPGASSGGAGGASCDDIAHVESHGIYITSGALGISTTYRDAREDNPTHHDPHQQRRPHDPRTRRDLCQPQSANREMVGFHCGKDVRLPSGPSEMPSAARITGPDRDAAADTRHRVKALDDFQPGWHAARRYPRRTGTP